MIADRKKRNQAGSGISTIITTWLSAYRLISPDKQTMILTRELKLPYLAAAAVVLLDHCPRHGARIGIWNEYYLQ